MDVVPIDVVHLGDAQFPDGGTMNTSYDAFLRYGKYYSPMLQESTGALEFTTSLSIPIVVNGRSNFCNFRTLQTVHNSK
jgi:hypothetical protein